MLLIMNEELSHSYCALCQKKIKDKYYLAVGNKKLHNACIRCSKCSMGLSNEVSCYEKMDEIYCRSCYFRLFSVTKCMGCNKGISKNDLVMEAKDSFYHVNCFRCSYCLVLLTKGQRFGIRLQHVFCEEHFLTDVKPKLTDGFPLINDETFDTNHRHIKKEIQTEQQLQSPSAIQDKEMLAKVQDVFSIHNMNKNEYNIPDHTEQYTLNNNLDYKENLDHKMDIDSNISMPSSMSSPSVPDGEINRSGSTDGECSDEDSQRYKMGGTSRKPRRRTRFQNYQLIAMRDLFELDKNPDSTSLKNLSEKIGLPKRVLQVWFQNARAKRRKGQNIFSEPLEKLLSPQEDLQ